MRVPRAAAAALLAALLVGLLGLGCISVELPVPVARVVPLGVSGDVELEAKSARRVVDYRHSAVGLANRFRVPVGRALDDYARVFLGAALGAPADGGPAGGERAEREPISVRIALEEVRIVEFALLLTTRFSVERGGGVVFAKTYVAEAPSYFAGVMSDERADAAQALRRTTHEALVLTLREFLVDLRALLEA